MEELDLEVASLDAIPEALHGLYAEADGKFRLKVKGVEPVDGLKSALDKERKAARELEKRVKRWESLGKSDEEISALLKKAEDHELAEAERKGEWEKLRTQMNEKHAEALRAEAEKASRMRGTLERYLVDAAATSAIASAKGVPELLLPHVQRHMRVVEEGGEFVAQVVDAKGDPRVNGKGEPLTVADLVAEMRQSEIYGRAFEGSGQSGSGMHPGNGAGGTGIAKKSDFRTEKDRAAWVEKHGFDAYRALPDG